MTRVVVTGATGNVGTSVLRALSADPAVDEIVGLARRLPQIEFPRTRFVAADVAHDDLVSRFRGADAVVHLAWLIQPSRDRALTRLVNLDGSRRVFEAAAAAGVPALVHASSVGAYSPGPKDRRVDESWPTGGVRTSFYSRDKADVERAARRVRARASARCASCGCGRGSSSRPTPRRRSGGCSPARSCRRRCCGAD